MRTLLLFVLLLFARFVTAGPLHIVAAENIYGSVAKQIGGEYVEVYSILNNPNQDPHLFSASHTTAKSLAHADIVIANGAGYDAWVNRLLSAHTHKSFHLLVVAQLTHQEKTDNPHLWYAPQTMPIYAEALTKLLITKDPTHQKHYAKQLQKFIDDYQGLKTMIQKLKTQYKNTPIIATEPLFNYMADALGFKVYGNAFQMNIMNDIEPTPTQVKLFEDALRNHQVKLLIYNRQVTNPLTQHMQEIAQTVKIPVVGMSEMLPPEKTYITWMQDELNQLEQALRVQHNSQ